MPSFILCAAPEGDLYCEWSSVVDGPTWIGTREEALAEFEAERVERAARAGSSALFGDPPYLGYDDGDMVVLNGGSSNGILRRDVLGSYLKALLGSDDFAAADALLQPLEDDDDA